MNSYRWAVITLIFTKNNCSKKSWNANERFPRRRKTRKDLRLASDAPSDEIFAAVLLASLGRTLDDVWRRSYGHPRPLPDSYRRGPLHRPRCTRLDHQTCCVNGAPLARARLPRFPDWKLRPAICPGAHHA